jgi:hypothetical protein
LVNTIST